jgi:hypothetical protein
MTYTTIYGGDNTGDKISWALALNLLPFEL